MRRATKMAVFVSAWAVFAAGRAGAGSVVVPATEDNTIYETATNTQSNGAGVYLFSGYTGNAQRRRALLRFEIASAIPSGATIDSVSLRLRVSRIPNSSPGNQSFSLRRVLASWGQGTSNAGVPGGAGATAASSDATWLHRFFPGTLWTIAGGEFSATSSASATVGAAGSLPTWGSSAGMVADVQAWLDNPSTNFGWILIGNETTLKSARRFDSREASIAANRPALTVQYTVGTPSTAGAVPDGAGVPGTPLTLDKGAGGALDLSWSESCAATAVDYEVYEGVLGDFTSHIPVTCSTVGATGAGVLPGAGDRYYLVVPTDSAVEGSYGRASDGSQRPPSASSCRPQSLGTQLCP